MGPRRFIGAGARFAILASATARSGSIAEARIMPDASSGSEISKKYFDDSRRSRTLTFLPIPADSHQISLSRINFLSGEPERYR